MFSSIRVACRGRNSSSFCNNLITKNVRFISKSSEKNNSDYLTKRETTTNSLNEDNSQPSRQKKIAR